MDVTATIAFAMLFSLVTSKAIGKLEHPKYLTPTDFELGEKLRKVQQPQTMPLSAHLLEGDIVGIKDPNAYMEQLHAAMTQNESNGHANAIKSPLGKWPNAIVPYSIDGNVNAKARAAVASAIKEIQEKTCAKIVPRTKEDHYLSVETGKGGCNSNVGRTTSLTDFKQILNLGKQKEYGSCWHLINTLCDMNYLYLGIYFRQRV